MGNLREAILLLEYLLLMCCHIWVMSYTDEMPSVLLNPVFLTLLLAVLFVTDTAIGKQLDKRFGKTPSSITFYSDRKSVTLLTEQILEDSFLRTHRSFIVNINQVTKAECDAIMLGDITIPVSRKYKEVVATKIATTT